MTFKDWIQEHTETIAYVLKAFSLIILLTQCVQFGLHLTAYYSGLYLPIGLPLYYVPATFICAYLLTSQSLTRLSVGISILMTTIALLTTSVHLQMVNYSSALTVQESPQFHPSSSILPENPPSVLFGWNRGICSQDHVCIQVDKYPGGPTSAPTPALPGAEPNTYWSHGSTEATLINQNFSKDPHYFCESEHLSALNEFCPCLTHEEFLLLEDQEVHWKELETDQDRRDEYPGRTNYGFEQFWALTLTDASRSVECFVYPHYNGALNLGGGDRPFENTHLRVRVNDHTFSYTQQVCDLLFGLNITECCLLSIMFLISFLYVSMTESTKEPIRFETNWASQGVFWSSAISALMATIMSIAMIFSPPYLHLRLQMWAIIPLFAISMNIRGMEIREDSALTVRNILLFVFHTLGTIFLSLSLGECWRISFLAEHTIPHGKTVLQLETPTQEPSGWILLHTLFYSFLLLFEVILMVFNILWIVGFGPNLNVGTRTRFVFSKIHQLKRNI